MNDRESSSSGFVQTNSVQSQFAVLTRDRDRFRNDMEAAEQQRRLAESQCRNLKSTQLNLIREIRIVQGELGNVSRKEIMLDKEKCRLQCISERERNCLEECCHNAEALVEEEIKRKQAFCREFEPLNANLAELLERETGYNIQKYLSVESVQEVVLNKLCDGADSNAINESFLLMQEATKKYDSEIQRGSQATRTLCELRTQVKQIETNVDWDAKEKLWGREDFSLHVAISDSTNTDSQTQQMDLFYGSERQQGPSFGGPSHGATTMEYVDTEE